MTPDRHQQIGQLLEAALERTPADRDAYLTAACGGDEELRKEVVSLLEARARARSSVEAPPAEAMAEALGGRHELTMIGRMLGHYKVVSLIGAGGMGEVYRARDTRLDREVAVKILPKKFISNQDRVRRFSQEARAASGLNHPNILTIFQIGEDSDVHFIVTEYIAGQTLRQLTAGGPLAPGAALDVAAQVAGALQAAHQARVVHRDVKPENIMLRPDGLVKVLDFGLAKLIAPSPSVDTTVADSGPSTMNQQIKTDPGRLMGTARYMSPEQICGQEVDGRSDVFSLGVVLYELLTGQAPFVGATAVEVMAAVLHREPEPITHRANSVTAEIERIVSRALAKETRDRYQSAADFLTDLSVVKQELEFEARLKRTEPKLLAERPSPPGLRRATARLRRIELELLAEAGGPRPESPAPQSPSPRPYRPPKMLEPVGGAVPLDSKFYIVRPADAEFESAIARQDSIVLVKGARQVGKTSLLARGLQRARRSGARVVITDFQGLSDDCLESPEKLFLRLAELIADQLDLATLPEQVWNPHLGPSSNFERYLRREALAQAAPPLVWGLDEVDRLFACDFGSGVFGLFRSWHNKRALDPLGPWRQLTLAIAYATEAHLFITDLNQSPFNVGTQLLLDDFAPEQVAELNRRHGSPLRTGEELERYYRLIGGHPYLVRRGLHEMAAHGLDLAALEARADHDDGPFGNHLRRLLLSLAQDRSLCEAFLGVLQGRPSLTTDSFYRLHSAGLIAGDSVRQAMPRCQLYATYLKGHLP